MVRMSQAGTGYHRLVFTSMYVFHYTSVTRQARCRACRRTEHARFPEGAVSLHDFAIGFLASIGSGNHFKHSLHRSAMLGLHFAMQASLSKLMEIQMDFAQKEAS